MSVDEHSGRADAEADLVEIGTQETRRPLACDGEFTPNYGLAHADVGYHTVFVRNTSSY